MFAQQKLIKHYAEVTATTGLVLISAHIIYHFLLLQWFNKWDKELDINPEDETSNPTEYQEGLLDDRGNANRAKHQCLPVNEPENIRNNNLFSSTMAYGSGHTSYQPYDLSSNDEEY
jgi:hypothetical protein